MKEYSTRRWELAYTFGKTAGPMPTPKGDGWILIDTKVGGAGMHNAYTVWAYFFWARKKC